MKKVQQNESFNQEDRSGSADNLNRSNSTNTNHRNNSNTKSNLLRNILLIIFIGAIAYFAYFGNTPAKIEQTIAQEVFYQSTDEPQKYKYFVYCPVKYIKPTPRNDDDSLRRVLEQQIDPQKPSNHTPINEDRTYIVRSISKLDDANNSKLYYCGQARGFYQTCEQSRPICSTPGPLFDITTDEVNHHIDVIWVNELDGNFIPIVPNNNNTILNSCLNQSYVNETGQYCKLMAKTYPKRTYDDPTSEDMSGMEGMMINKDNWPSVAHVHGAQVRPTFDGNPLSWIDNHPYNQSIRGTGALSVTDKCYYDAFNSIQSKSKNSLLPPSDISKYLKEKDFHYSSYKVNRYPNIQNPGMLWYHDHAMRLTAFNAGGGLSGFYFLRDAKVQKIIDVPKENQILIMMSKDGITPSTDLSSLSRGVKYRFRFLNNNILGLTKTVKVIFKYNNCDESNTDIQHFTIIGADSSLFDQSIDRQTNIVLSNAQRIDLLIVFPPIKQLVCMCISQNFTIGHGQSHINNKIAEEQYTTLTTKSINLIDPPKTQFRSASQNINNITLGVHFTDLNLLDDSQIAVKRMRSLIHMGNKIFTIQGRTDFHKGKSENPTIGTVQDWFLLNTIPLGHPIHIHLINFQVIGSYNTRLIRMNPASTKDNCSIYQLDQLASAILLALQKNPQVLNKTIYFDEHQFLKYHALCVDRIALQLKQEIKQAFNEIYPEDQVIDRISGLNVLTTVKQREESLIHLMSLNIDPPINWEDGQTLLYVQKNDDLDYKPYYRKWKDTAYVESYKMLHYRIRWTKSEFTESDGKNGHYFNVPADQLIEYPGYVYHCHILPHEDNEMMRPIMLQLPSDFKLDKNIPCNYDENMKPLLKWADRYRCINERCQNK